MQPRNHEDSKGHEEDQNICGPGRNALTKMTIKLCIPIVVLMLCGAVVRAHEIGTTRVSVLLHDEPSYTIEIVTDAAGAFVWTVDEQNFAISTANLIAAAERIQIARRSPELAHHDDDRALESDFIFIAQSMSEAL